MKNRANQKIRQNQKRTKEKLVFFFPFLCQRIETHEISNKTKWKIPREHSLWTYNKSRILQTNSNSTYQSLNAKNIVVLQTNRLKKKKKLNPIFFVNHNNMPLFEWNEHIHTTRTAKNDLFAFNTQKLCKNRNKMYILWVIVSLIDLLLIWNFFSLLL